MRYSKLLKMIRYDLKCGIWDCIPGYVGAVFMSVFFFTDYSLKFRNSCQSIDMLTDRPTLTDYMIYCFAGRKPYQPGEPVFLVPIGWLIFFLYGALLTLNYPLKNLDGHGIQVLIRTERRSWWWFSKCIYILCSTLLFFLIFHSTNVILSLISGMQCTLQFREKFMNTILMDTFLWVPGNIDLVLLLFLMPFLLSLFLNLLQLFMGLYLKRTYVFMLTAVLLLLSCYFQHWLLPGIYAMVKRSIWMTEMGTDSKSGILYFGVLLSLVVLCGLKKILRYDVLRKE